MPSPDARSSHLPSTCPTGSKSLTSAKLKRQLSALSWLQRFHSSVSAAFRVVEWNEVFWYNLSFFKVCPLGSLDRTSKNVYDIIHLYVYWQPKINSIFRFSHAYTMKPRVALAQLARRPQPDFFSGVGDINLSVDQNNVSPVPASPTLLVRGLKCSAIVRHEASNAKFR